MKRMISVLMIIALLCAMAAGCSKPVPTDAMAQFLADINASDFAAAYDLLHSSSRYDEVRQKQDEAEGKTQPSDRITKEQFVKRYTAIFNELQIKGLTYNVTKEVEGEAICVYDYTLTYDSELLGNTPMEFRMSVLRENGLWTVEWTPALLFPGMDWGDTVRVTQLPATRGEILADGVVYAQTVKAVSIIAVPEKIEDTEQFVREVSMLLGMTQSAVQKKLDKAFGDFTILKQLYPDELTASLEEQLLLIPGISVDKSNFGTLRYYPQEESLAHILGYVGPASAEDLKALTGSETGNEIYNTDSRVGKTGLERVYEKELRGTDGRMIYISGTDGLNKDTLFEGPAQDGLDVQLSLDPDLQARTEVLLKYSLFGDDTAGAVVVLDPTTGRVEAMASYPSYNLNQFTRGISEADWQALTTQANKPMFNRLTQGRYPPGSIFKPFTASVALESGAMTPNTAFPMNVEKIEEDKWIPADRGEFGPWGYAAITRVALNNRHSPPLNMKTGMIDSDNIYFAYAALRTGEAAFEKFMETAGYTESIPFEITVAAPQLKNKDAQWTPMLLAESSFGQGEVLVTPLQAAVMFSAFANGGSIETPFLVNGLYRTEGTSYAPVTQHEVGLWKENVVQRETVNTIVPMLEDVISMGTGNWLHLDNIAGKTGTAQIGSDRSREISWFVGFRVGSDDPRLVLVMLEVPANQHDLALTRFDIARALLRKANTTG